VAPALACDVPDIEPSIIISPNLKAAFDRVLPDILNFLFQLSLVSYDVVEAFIKPHRSISLDPLIDLPCRSTLDSLKDSAEFFEPDNPEDCVRMTRHHNRRVQIDTGRVASLERGHHEIAGLERKRDVSDAAKRHEVGSTRNLDVWQVAAREDETVRLPGIDRSKAMRISL
jgi:hypothetical protein